MAKAKPTLKDLGISMKDLLCLEDYLIAIPLCKEHNHQIALADCGGRTWESVWLEDSWKTCKKCNALYERWWHGAWRVQGKLFELVPDPLSKLKKK